MKGSGQAFEMKFLKRIRLRNGVRKDEIRSRCIVFKRLDWSVVNEFGHVEIMRDV